MELPESKVGRCRGWAGLSRGVYVLEYDAWLSCQDYAGLEARGLFRELFSGATMQPGRGVLDTGLRPALLRAQSSHGIILVHGLG